jgi:uncharacterized Tic20 family protein
VSSAEQSSGSSASAAPGWYPAPDGTTRWWDGSQWGVAAPATSPATAASTGAVSDDPGLAVLAHVLGIFTGFLGPLVIYLVAKPEQPFTKHHAAEALNFQITVTIAYIVSFVAIFLLIGIIMLPLVWIGSLVLMIMASIAANRGEWYRYPVNIRLVPGAVGG